MSMTAARSPRFIALAALPLLGVLACSGPSPEPSVGTTQGDDSSALPSPRPADGGPRGDSANGSRSDSASEVGTQGTTAPALAGVFVPTFGQPLATESTLQQILTTPSLRATIDGFYIQRPWSELEPSDGTFDFTDLDDDLSTAMANHAKVTISVGAGSAMPSWLCGTAGAKCASFVQTIYAQPGVCTSFSVPVPWDSVFQNRWAAFIAALATHLVKYESIIAAIKMTGINADTNETQLPHDSGDSVSCTSGPACSHGTCAVTDAPAAWTALGYSTSVVLTAWGSIQDEFAKAFPSTVLDVELVGNGFPDDPTDTVINTIVSSGLAQLKGRFAVQSNGLNATGGVPTVDVQAAGEGAIVGYQMLQKVSGDPSCVMAKGLPAGTPCNATVLEDAINVGLADHASFLEIYSTDVPAFPSTVACAHAELALSPSSERTCK
jgi:hypothetical protein